VRFLAKEKVLPSIFVRPKPIKVLTSLKAGPKYATILSKEADLTYSHTVKLLDQFKTYGLVEFEKKGRIKIIKLTNEGQDLAHAFDTALIKLSKIKEKSSVK
jgi:predicted transcriptional regulator